MTTRESNFNNVKKRVTSLSSTKKDTTVHEGGTELPYRRPISTLATKRQSVRSKISKSVPICKTKKKPASAFIRSAANEEIDLDEQLGKGMFCDDKDSMWLSSDSFTPSSFFDQYRLSSSLHLIVDEWLISWLSTLASAYVHIEKGNYSTLSEGLNTSPKMDASEKLGSDEISTITGSEAARSSCGLAIEDSITCDTCLTPSSASTPSSETADLDGTSLLFSLVNLDDEDSKWISDTESELDCFRSGFPSPSCRSNWSSEVTSTSSSNLSTPSEVKDEHNQCDSFSDNPYSEAGELEELTADEPLFWPYEWKPDWSSEKYWRHSMSPRKGAVLLGTPARVTSEKSGTSKFRGSNINSIEGCQRRLEFSSSSSASTILERRDRNKSNGTERINSISSRSKNSTKISVELIPAENEHEIGVNIATDGGIPQLRADCMSGVKLEDDFAPNVELPIETLLGLGEFDGHEGLDFEYNEDIFSLDESL